MGRGASASKPASGRFLLRLEPKHHAALRSAAADQGLSLNEYCARRLAMPEQPVPSQDWTSLVVRRAAEMFGEKLVGVVAFGSWARGDEAGGSDIDVLVVLESEVTIDRSLYRKWDETPVVSGHRLVDPHFVHLPQGRGKVSGLWLEVARDGIVLYERGFRISRSLIAGRQQLIAGNVVRREVFGQPYWMEVGADAES